MDLMAVNVADPVELREFAERAVVEAGQYASAAVEGLRQARSKARAVATNTIDILFSDPADAGSPQYEQEVIRRYESLLRSVEEEQRQLAGRFYSSRLEFDQGLAFYLLHASRATDLDAADLRRLIAIMTEARAAHANGKASTTGLMEAFSGSAGALPGLESAVSATVQALRDVHGELDVGEAVLSRHINSAEHLMQVRALL